MKYSNREIYNSMWFYSEYVHGQSWCMFTHMDSEMGLTSSEYTRCARLGRFIATLTNLKLADIPLYKL